jgi:hypothetical protein
MITWVANGIAAASSYRPSASVIERFQQARTDSPVHFDPEANDAFRQRLTLQHVESQ